MRALWFFILLSVWPSSVLAEDANATLALVGATIYTTPTAAPVRDGVIVVVDGKIAAVGTRAQVKIPPSAEILDCAGRTITAGFWNSHVHFMERKWADARAIPADDLAAHMRETFTRHGFTAAFDISSVLENTVALRKRIDAGEVPGPRIFTTGLGMVPPGSQVPEGIYSSLGWTPVRLPEIADAAAADAAVSATLAAGANGIKLFVSGAGKTQLTPATMRAAVGEAHRLGWPVFVHPTSNADIVAAANAGADIIAHTTPLSDPWDDAVLAAMEDQGVALIPTLWMWRSVARQSGPEAESKAVEAGLAQLRAWTSRRGTVLFGTDLGAVPPDPAPEYALMIAAGMDFRAILASLTLAPAKRFGRGADLGQIAPGFLADLAILKEDPSTDARRLASVQFTLREGEVIYRAP